MTSADTTSYADSSAVLGTITTVHLIIIAVFALLAVLAIVWGIRLRARRKAGEAEVREHNETVERKTPLPTKAPVAGDVVEDRLPEEVGRVAPTPPPAPAPEPEAPEPPRLADEPIAAAAPLDASPAALASDMEAAPAASAPAYRLTDLKGLGPKVAARLEELGVTGVADLAALSDADAAALNAQLGPFAGRMERDRWREQARLLATGDKAGFEAAFGKL